MSSQGVEQRAVEIEDHGTGSDGKLRQRFTLAKAPQRSTVPKFPWHCPGTELNRILSIIGPECRASGKSGRVIIRGQCLRMNQTAWEGYSSMSILDVFVECNECVAGGVHIERPGRSDEKNSISRIGSVPGSNRSARLRPTSPEHLSGLQARRLGSRLRAQGALNFRAVGPTSTAIARSARAFTTDGRSTMSWGGCYLQEQGESISYS